ncbi:hypothetical protein [Mycobacterium sp. 236(2023)]|uniref:hypothetical protein n=1 Tax=Mycobacterium sp. 236(2023) TaxID=3038163 RepID=UPI002414DC05|nr:hypothetical protein [Mycobacterium sp. 236(2023)]MDG4666623.1 hypothetical protein [Mycobacterium sp. 236(2023)]
MNESWVRGDATGLVFPAHPDALRDSGIRFLGEAFRAWGVLGADNDVARIDRFEEVGGGSTGRKALMSVRYEKPHPGLATELFVKFSRDLDDETRDAGRTQMESEVRFAELTRASGFPIAVPATQFADYHRDSGTGVLISERIPFGTKGIEPQYLKCLDYEMPEQFEHYRAVVVSLARLAGAHRAGVLPAALVDRFPVDLQAATVGQRRVLTADQLDRKLARLVDFIAEHPGLFPGSVGAPELSGRLMREAHAVVAAEPAIWRLLAGATDHIALCHWNANVDNAWFWRDADQTLRCGLMDWGCVSQMNVAMALWGALSAAETGLWNAHLDDLLRVFCAEVRGMGGPELDPDLLRPQLALYAVLMGVTWLLDVPARIRSRVPDLDGDTARTDPRIKGNEAVRAPLQMLVNVLNVWGGFDIGELVRRLAGHDRIAHTVHDS